MVHQVPTMQYATMSTQPSEETSNPHHRAMTKSIDPPKTTASRRK